MSEGKWGFIDKTGKFVIEPMFNWSESFHEGLCVVKLGNKYGFIDRTGRFVIEPRFEKAAPFSESLARVLLIGDSNRFSNQFSYKTVFYYK